jgi:prepilin-type processing-associated H-X9-DG protein
MTCISNERQLGVALLQYCQENDQAFPPGAHYSDGRGWAGEIYQYVKSTAPYKCPGDNLTPSNVFYKGPYYVCSYAYNINLSSKLVKAGKAAREKTTINALPSPEKTVALSEITGNVAKVDNNYGHFDEDSAASFGAYRYDGFSPKGQLKGDTGYLGTPPAINPSWSLNPVGRHGGAANYLMADGHVKYVLGAKVSPGASARYPTDRQGKDTAKYGDIKVPTAAGTGAAAPSFQATFSAI